MVRVTRSNGEWYQFEEEARASLLSPPRRFGFTVECHAVLLPSFKDCRAYTLLDAGARESHPVVGVRRIWRRRNDREIIDAQGDRPADSPRLTSTIELSHAPMARELLDDILGRAAELRIPPNFLQRRTGCDGTTYALSFGEHFVAARFEWWQEPPAGWEGLGLLFDEVVSAVDDALDTVATDG